MSKYPNEQTVGAVYDDAPVGNPFLAAMPDMFPPEKVFEKIGSKLPIPHNLSDMTAEERRRQIPVLVCCHVRFSAYMAITSSGQARKWDIRSTRIMAAWFG